MRKFLISLTAIAVGVPAFAQYTPVKKEDAVTFTGGSIGVSSSSGIGTLTATGYEAYDGRLILDADEGDDAADTWTIESEAADNDLSILNSTSERVQLTAAGALTLKGGDLTVDGGVSGTVYSVTAQGGEASDARLSLDADDGDDNADTWFIESEAADNDLSFVNHTTERAKLTSAGALHVDTINELGTSGVTLEGMVLNDGAFTDADGTLTIGTTIVGVLLDVNEDIDVDLNANDEEVNITVTNTAARVVTVLGNDANPGSSTLLTLDLTADGDSDAEYFECRDNAAADSKFKIDVDGNTTIAGTLGVTGVSTLTGGATVSEDIAVNFDANDEEVLVTITNTSANPVRILGNDANPGSSTLLTLDLTADGDADAEYIICRDNASADTKFKVDADGATTVGSLSTGTGEATVDGKYATVGPDATTGLMVLSAAITSTGTTMTNTFATAFGAAPQVVCTYTESATTNIYLGTITASNFISFHESSKNYNYIAVGQRP